MNESDRRHLESARSTADVEPLLRLADRLAHDGNPHAAATALDRAYGLDPSHGTVASRRADLFDRLSVTENGIRFRYVPAGAFLMGSDRGDPDEVPVHEVRLSRYWLSETPVSWATYCRVVGWEPPPQGTPPQPAGPAVAKGFDRERFEVVNDAKICLQYCEDQTRRARDWHAHLPPPVGAGGDAERSRRAFGTVDRHDPGSDFTYDTKPMVSVRFAGAEKFAAALSGGGSPSVSYRLPTEAEWEKGARGGLVGKPYPWGEELPTDLTCDFDRFKDFSIRPMKAFAPNGYGLYAMSGGVWEWTGDRYDAAYFGESPAENPMGPAGGTFRVVRGGSWADCAGAVTVSFRMTSSDGDRPMSPSPNIGFRICRSSPPTTGE